MLSINPSTISCQILHIHFENLYDKGECNFELKRTNGKMLRYYILILLQKSCKLNKLFEWCNTINLINKLQSQFQNCTLPYHKDFQNERGVSGMK